MLRPLIALLAVSLLCPLLPTAAQEPVTIRVMSIEREITPELIAEFEAANPNMHVEVIDAILLDTSVTAELARMQTLEEPLPDIIRVQANDMPALVEGGWLLDLTGHFAASPVIEMADLAHAANYYKFGDHYYGLPKDWSPDFSLFAYHPAFEAAGIPLPSAEQPLTYAELADIARQLTVRDGDTVTSYGLYLPYYERLITSILMQHNTGLFNADYSEMHLTDNPVAMEVVRFFYDLTLEGTLSPDRTYFLDAWEGTLPLFQWGYWYGGSLSETSPMAGQLTMLPAPQWDRALPRMDPTVGPTGLAITAASSHPDEAYRFFEWYIAGEAAAARTANGWGAPALLSMFDLLPQDTPFNRQRFQVLMGELPYSGWQLPIYPYESIAKTFDTSWEANMALALRGEIDFPTFASNLQEAINLAILNEQIERAQADSSTQP